MLQQTGNRSRKGFTAKPVTYRYTPAHNRDPLNSLATVCADQQPLEWSGHGDGRNAAASYDHID
jgi:hypothetical protein